MTRRAAALAWRARLVIGTVVLLGGVLVGVGLAPGAGSGATERSAEPSATTHARSSSAAEDRSVNPSALVPVRLHVPAIALTTPLVRLGLEPDRTVEVPGPDRAGWFRHGPAPGEPGSSVILGHVDSVEGPAVFARLQELQRGDVLTVDRADGASVRFVVDRSVLYDNADFPADQVYAAGGGRRLNLVTCGGSYDSARGGYQSNLVVYSQRFGRGLID